MPDDFARSAFGRGPRRVSSRHYRQVALYASQYGDAPIGPLLISDIGAAAAGADGD